MEFEESSLKRLQILEGENKLIFSKLDGYKAENFELGLSIIVNIIAFIILNGWQWQKRKWGCLRNDDEAGEVGEI